MIRGAFALIAGLAVPGAATEADRPPPGVRCVDPVAYGADPNGARDSAAAIGKAPGAPSRKKVPALLQSIAAAENVVCCRTKAEFHVTPGPG
jgi:hypothetical protein